MKKTKLYDKWMNSFQKKVFQLENIKFKIEDKLFSIYDKHAEKRSNKKLNKELEKLENIKPFIKNYEQERELIIEKNKFLSCSKCIEKINKDQIRKELETLDEFKPWVKNYEQKRESIIRLSKYCTLRSRKEEHRKENMNYHLNRDDPEETLAWLNINKKIHQKGLKKKGFKIPIALILLVLSLGTSVFGPITFAVTVFTIIGLIKETLFGIIDINCILLQNYNIKRVNKYIEGPYQRHKQKLEKQAIEYSEAAKEVSEVLKENEEIPDIEEFIANIQTSEQVKLLLEIVQPEMNYFDNKVETNNKVR